MAITAAQVKELRDSTGAGMMDAKKALTENDGDMEAAVDWLRTKGLAKAAKKSGRTAAEGLVAVKTDAGVGVAVEVNSETDFVAKNAEFQEMVGTIAGLALNVDSVDELSGTDVGNGKPVSENDHRQDCYDRRESEPSPDGENFRWQGRQLRPQRGDRRNGRGSASSLRLTETTLGIARQIAMHVAAASPAALNEAALDAEFVARERQVLTEQARESGKPEAVIEKMIDGRMKKFYAENTLLGQAFVVNPDVTVEAAAKDAGITITGFVRMAVGEGIEKEADDFAAEVAAMNKS